MSRHIYRIEGERVALTVLRPDQETREKLVEWLADEEIIANNYMTMDITTLAGVEDWIMDKSSCRLGIVLKETDELIGFCHVDYPVREMVVEMGLAIGVKELRGRGIGTDVVRTILKYSFEALNVLSVHLYVLQSNERAVACYKRCGFVVSGQCRRWGYFKGPLDWYFMDIVREEYDAACAAEL